jgi:DNA-binding transcriptional regulator YdaS (Cro superfamily)
MNLPEWLNAQRGRKSGLAARLGVPPSFVIKMANGEKPVPLEHCPAIQEFTGGAVTCEELRPDKAGYFAMIRAQSRAATAPAAIKNVVQGVA